MLRGGEMRDCLHDAEIRVERVFNQFFPVSGGRDG